MKIELSNDLIKYMYYFHMLKVDDNKHKDCRHIFLESVEDDACEFLCADCLVGFRSSIKESENPYKFLNEYFKNMLEQTIGYKLWKDKHEVK